MPLGDANALLPHELLRLVLMDVQPSACSSGLGLCHTVGGGQQNGSAIYDVFISISIRRREFYKYIDKK